jgi:hypothetical protein
MKSSTRILATVVAATVLTAIALAQSAQDPRGRTPYIPIGKEPPAQLILGPPNPQALATGAVLIQYRAENVHIVPVFGPATLMVFPRVGHLRINVDDLPWYWADASDIGTIDNVRGRTLTVENEPPAQLIVDPPNPKALAIGVALIQYHAENVHIVPVFGPAALTVFPRVGHVHINLDNLAWHWADANDTSTIDITDLPPGQHTVRIDLVDGNHQLFPGQSKTVTFTVPGTTAQSQPDPLP